MQRSWGILKMVLKVSIPSCAIILLQDFQNQLDHFFQLLDYFWIIFYTVPVTSKWNILMQSFTVSTMGVIASLVFLIFPLCVKSNTLLGCLNLCTIISFQGGSPPSHLKIALSCVFSNQKSQKSYLFSHSRKKHNERQII